MTIEEMHYDFKKKFNKIDSQQNRNFLIPEIDWTLNEAFQIFVDKRLVHKKGSYLGIEINQKSREDIRTLVVSPDSDPSASISIINNIVSLPSNYWHFIKGEVLITKGKCVNIKARAYIQQLDDEFEESSFNKSSFEWRSVNGTYFENGIRLYTDGTFTNNKLNLTYIKKLPYINNCENFKNNTYTLPSGTILTTNVNCPLPVHTHKEIVDIAVLIASGEIMTPDYQLKLQKLNINNI